MSDPTTLDGAWVVIRDTAAIIAAVGVPFTVMIIGMFHTANLNRFQHLDNCIDGLKNQLFSAAKEEVTRDEMDATLTRMQGGLQERMATNMSAVTSLMSQRELSLGSSLSSIREATLALETRVRRLEDHQMATKQVAR